MLPLTFLNFSLSFFSRCFDRPAHHIVLIYTRDCLNARSSASDSIVENSPTLTTLFSHTFPREIGWEGNPYKRTDANQSYIQLSENFAQTDICVTSTNEKVFTHTEKTELKMGFTQDKTQESSSSEGRNNKNTTLSHVDNGRHRFRHSTRKIGLFWTFCFVVIFCADTSLTYRLDDEDDISTNELLPPLASSYSSNVVNQESKNIKVFYQSGVSNINIFRWGTVVCRYKL